MSFMEPQIEYGTWYVVNGPAGTEYVPEDVCGAVDCELSGDPSLAPIAVPIALADYCENRTCWSVERLDGWGARLSAPGYMDCTEWAVLPTEEEARDYIREAYGICPDCGEDEDACACGRASLTIILYLGLLAALALVRC